MAYNSFKKIAQLSEQFGINHLMKPWLPKNLIRPTVSQTLLDALNDASQEALDRKSTRLNSSHVD